MASYQVVYYRARRPQFLRQINIHFPSLIQVLSGSKQIFMPQPYVLTSQDILLCHGHSKWQFINQPTRNSFCSRQFVFHARPSEELFAFSQIRQKSQIVLSLSNEMKLMLDTLAKFDDSDASEDTKQLLLMGTYQQLAELGCLHLLFPKNEHSLKQRLVTLFNRDPSANFQVSMTAELLGMSRATLLRKLKQEDLAFKHLLLEVRLNHALALMQQRPMTLFDLATACGYLSTARFKERFETALGFSPLDYMRTIHEQDLSEVA